MWRIFCGFLCFCCSGYAQQPSILFVDAIGLLQGEAANSVEGQTFKHILAKLEGHYELTTTERNRARSMLLSEPRACSPWLKKTAERSLKFSFTVPYMYEPGLVLLVHQSSQWLPFFNDRSNQTGTIPLTELVQQEKPPLIGIESNRSYGEELDSILQQYVDKLYVRTSSSSGPGSMLPMLERQFIDATIEYPGAARLTKIATMQFRLTEAHPYSAVHIGCSKSAQGQDNVRLINQAIQELARDNAYRQLVLQHVGETLAERVATDWESSLAPLSSH